jgi:hypothetical protein
MTQEGGRSAIISQIAAGADFANVAERFGVTFSVVWALAYEPDNYLICSTCNGSGKVAAKSGAVGRCEDCLGAGCISK